MTDPKKKKKIWLGSAAFVTECGILCLKISPSIVRVVRVMLLQQDEYVSWTEKPVKRREGHFKVDLRNMP